VTVDLGNLRMFDVLAGGLVAVASLLTGNDDDDDDDDDDDESR